MVCTGTLVIDNIMWSHTCSITYLIESVNESINVFSVWFIFYIIQKKRGKVEYLERTAVVFYLQ